MYPCECTAMDPSLSPCVHGTLIVYCTYPVHTSIYTYVYVYCTFFSLCLILACVLSDGVIILGLCYTGHGRGVNPWCAWAAQGVVTVVCLFACLSVCKSLQPRLSRWLKPHSFDVYFYWYVVWMLALVSLMARSTA